MRHIATGLEATASRMEAIASRMDAVAIGMKAISIRLEAPQCPFRRDVSLRNLSFLRWVLAFQTITLGKESSKKANTTDNMKEQQEGKTQTRTRRTDKRHVSISRNQVKVHLQ